MEVASLAFEDFMNESKKYPVIDVRTPAEFELGHIPGARNIPLFSNEERAIVGTLYKKQGKEKAVEKGLEFVGPKLLSFVKQAKKLSVDKNVLVHCWRGGMRSASMAWLFNTAGLHARTLQGGYKSFRRAARTLFDSPLHLVVIGGFTGSGKTHFLLELRKKGLQVIDLEGLANHKGSAFGHIGEKNQPSTEQFENNLYTELSKLDITQPIFVEDESRSIGKVWIPDELFSKIRKAPVIVLKVPTEIRLDNLVKDYTHSPEVRNALIFSVNKIKKRLGGLRAQKSIQFIQENNYKEAAKEILPYYDKTYSYGLSQRNAEKIIEFEIKDENIEQAAENFLKDSAINTLLTHLPISHG